MSFSFFWIRSVCFSDSVWSLRLILPYALGHQDRPLDAGQMPEAPAKEATGHETRRGCHGPREEECATDKHIPAAEPSGGGRQDAHALGLTQLEKTEGKTRRTDEMQSLGRIRSLMRPILSGSQDRKENTDPRDPVSGASTRGPTAPMTVSTGTGQLARVTH